MPTDGFTLDSLLMVTYICFHTVRYWELFHGFYLPSPLALFSSLTLHFFLLFLLLTLACSYINFLIFWSMVTAEIIVGFYIYFISCTV